MNRLFSFLICVLVVTSLMAQSPEKMSYQAVVRNSSNELVTGQQIGVKISVLKGAESGDAVYDETHTPTTNANGLMSIEIGTGSNVSGSFSTIDWADGPYFVKSEIDIDGGSSYTITGTSQLLSVPYALYSNEAGNVNKSISLNVYASNLKNATAHTGFGVNAGIKFPKASSTSSFASSFTVPENYTEGDTIYVRMVASATNTGIVSFRPNFISVSRPGEGFIQGSNVSTGLYLFNTNIEFSEAGQPIEIMGYIVSPSSDTKLKPGDGIIFGYYRWASGSFDTNAGDLKIHAISLDY